MSTVWCRYVRCSTFYQACAPYMVLLCTLMRKTLPRSILLQWYTVFQIYRHRVHFQSSKLFKFWLTFKFLLNKVFEFPDIPDSNEIASIVDGKNNCQNRRFEYFWIGKSKSIKIWLPCSSWNSYFKYKTGSVPIYLQYCVCSRTISLSKLRIPLWEKYWWASLA